MAKKKEGRFIEYFPRVIFETASEVPPENGTVLESDEGVRYIVRHSERCKITSDINPSVKHDGWRVTCDNVYGEAKGKRPELKRILELE